MPSTPPAEKPRFTAVKVYNHPSGHLSFWHPPEWDLQASDSPHPAASLYPDPTDPATFVSITVQDMGQPLAPEERAPLAEGVQEGLEQLDGCVIESLQNLPGVGDWGQEWLCTFVQDGVRRRRRARLFCGGRFLYSVVIQGATEERYAHWQGMLEWVMLTVGMSQFSVQDWMQQQPLPDESE